MNSSEFDKQNQVIVEYMNSNQSTAILAIAQAHLGRLLTEAKVMHVYSTHCAIEAKDSNSSWMVEHRWNGEITFSQQFRQAFMDAYLDALENPVNAKL